MGLFSELLGCEIPESMRGGYGFQDMAAFRLAHGQEPIDWPKIIVNHFMSIAQTRPLTIVEQFTYDGALQALNKE